MEFQTLIRDEWLVPVEVPMAVECRNPDCRALIKVEIGETPATGPIIQCPICGRSEGHRYDCTYGM